MKYILMLAAVLLLFSCIPVEMPYLVLDVEDSYQVDPSLPAADQVVTNMKIPYEFSSESVLMEMRVVILRETGGGREIVWGFQELAAESGYIVINDDMENLEADLRFTGQPYYINAVLLSRRYGGEPQEIKSLEVEKKFNIIF